MYGCGPSAWSIDRALRRPSIASAPPCEPGCAGVRRRRRWRRAPGYAPASASIAGRRVDAVVSYLEPRNLDSLPSQGFARQNATIARPGGRDYAARFRTLDLQLATALRWGWVPITLRVEGARNLAVTRESDA